MNNTLKTLTVIFIAVFIFSCKKDKLSPPVITTTAISDISYNSATTGGSVTIDEGTTLISRGVCWNSTGNPTINDSKTDDGTNTGSFTSSLSSLKINTKYFVRAYAVNNIGTSYGTEITFSTLNPKLYIRGKLGNESLECYYSEERFNNYYTYAANPLEDRFYLLMFNKSELVKSRYLQIDINRIKIDTLRTPWENNMPVLYPKAYVNLYRVDFTRASELFASSDSVNYSGAGLFEDPVFVKIQSIIGDTIAGTFHGTLRTKTGLSKELTNGEFKIKFHRIQQ